MKDPGGESRKPRDGQKKRREQAAQALPAGRKLLYYLLTIGFPFLLLFILEGSLRIAHYGQDLSLFAPDTLNGRAFLNLNPGVQARYFTRHQFSATLAPSYFVSPKPPGTYRIFCLGASTTVGFPYWYNGSFPSFLKDRLRRIFPEKKLDVINVGLTATNSFTVSDMAADIADYEPDLLIIYDGHNEFYGALGIGSHESLGSVRWLTKLYLRLIRFDTFRVCRDLFTAAVGLFQHAPEETSSRPLMEILASGQYIPFRSKTYERALDIFKGNLEDLKEIAREHQVPVILASQVSNLRDRAPFISEDAEKLIGEARKAYHRLFDLGMKNLREGKADSAIQDFEQALSIDSLHADGHYWLARGLEAMGDKSQARLEYRKARDYDQLRFRASTDFNEALRSEADGRTVYFADMERAFENASPDSLIGNTLILEHLHPNSRGAFVLAKEYARTMREHHLFATDEEWRMRDTIEDEFLWQMRSVTEIDEMLARRRTEVLTAGWPFKNQTATVEAIPNGDTLRTIAEQLARRIWSWPQAHEAAASYYFFKRDYGNAIREYRAIIDQLPFMNIQYYLRLAELLLEENRTKEFAQVLIASLEVKPTISAYRALGDISMNGGKPADAVAYYERTSDFPQSRRERVENGYALALAYLRAERAPDAASKLAEILNLMPDYQPASRLLEKINARRDEKSKTAK
jgi:tetratricopeptide (TPR) repeat protein